MKLTKIITTRPYNELDITFWPTDICNFNCSYCFPGSKDGIYRFEKNLDIVLNKFKKLFADYSSIGKDKFNITIAGGGEPTLWPILDQFCSQITLLENVKIQLVTNGSRTLKWWSNNAKYLDKVHLSCHSEDVDIDHFINVADVLTQKGTEVTAMMLMDAKRWDLCVSYIDKMQHSKEQWKILAKEVVAAPGHDIDSYTNKQLEYIKRSTKRFVFFEKDISEYRTVESLGFYDDKSFPAYNNTYIANKQNYFKGWNCNMPVERISVDAGLNIKGSCGVNFDKLDSIICPLDCCDCQPDTHITKFI